MMTSMSSKRCNNHNSKCWCTESKRSKASKAKDTKSTGWKDLNCVAWREVADLLEASKFEWQRFSDDDPL